MDPHYSILYAEDDPEDIMLFREAYEDVKLEYPLTIVNDGEELINYLRNLPPYNNKKENPLPGLILLDLNLPRMDGRECLSIIKNDPILKKIPVIILTTSKAEEDIVKTYDLGVNSFITKPVTYSSLLETVKLIGKYWFETVILPKPNKK